MTVIGAGSYSIKSVNYNNDITVIKDNQDTDTNVSSSSINSKLDNAEAASDKSVDDVYADDEQVKEVDKTPRHSDPKNFTFDFKKGNEFNLEGATRDYEDINVSKALTDMKKDEVLEQYKFFVDSPNLGTDTDGTVRIVRR